MMLLARRKVRPRCSHRSSCSSLGGCSKQAPNCMGPKSRMSRVAQTPTDIQAEVRRQVSEFMAQQAQAMNHLQRENAVLRERLDAQQSPPQLTQSINPNPKVDLPQPQGQPRSFHPGRSEALVPLQGSSAPQEGVQAPEGKGIGGLGIHPASTNCTAIRFKPSCFGRVHHR